jgi:CBS domain-containing protein
VVSAKVSMILARKGTQVATIGPDATLTTAAIPIAEHNVGALVVSDDGTSVQGILSERDIVREIARSGVTHWSRRPVSDVMTREVTVCSPSSTLDELMGLMTRQRIRHIPVVDERQQLAGIVSIGDIVKTP